MAIVRKAGGQLVETVQQDAAGQPIIAPEPITPAGGAAAGDNEHAAKMRGTPAQKAPVLKEAVAPGQTLQEQQRLTPQTQPASPIDQQAAEKAGRLKSLGSYGTRVQKFIEEKLKASQLPAPTIMENVAGIAGMFPGDEAKQKLVRDATAKYLKDKTPAAMAELSNLIGRPLDAATLAELTTSATDALSTATAGLTQDAPPTLAEIGLDQLGVDPKLLAQDLGVTPKALAAYTPDQLQQAVQDTLNREFSSVDALKAEYRTASPNRKAQIMEQLRQADATGRGGVEASVAHLSDVLESQETVSIGGQEYNIADVLGDDGISKVIENALTSEDALKALEADPTTKGLATWIRDNQVSLKKLVDDMQTQGTQLATAQTDAAKLLEPLGAPGSALAVAFGSKAGTLTPDEVKALEARLKTDPLYQAALKDPALMEALQDDPGLVAKWRNVPPADLPSILAAGKSWDTATDEERQLLQQAGFAEGMPKDAAGAAALSGLLTALRSSTPPVPAASVLAALKGVTPKSAPEMFTPEGMTQVVKSMALLSDASVGPELRKLMGLGPKDAYSRPGKGPSVEDMEKWKTRYDATLAELDRAGLDHAGFKSLVADGTITTAAELKAIRQNPALVTEIVEDRQTQKSLDSVTKLLTDPKTRAKGQDAFAKMVLGPNAKFADIITGIDSANSVLKSPKKFTPEALERAKAFLRQFKGFDADGNGVTSADFQRDTRYNHLDKEGVEAKAAARLAASLAALTGVDSAESLLSGKKGKPNKLAGIRNFWDTTYGGWGTGKSRYAAASDTSGADAAQAGIDKEAKQAAIAAAAAEMKSAGDAVRQAERVVAATQARVNKSPNSQTKAALKAAQDDLAWKKKLLGIARQKHKDAVAAK